MESQRAAGKKKEGLSVNNGLEASIKHPLTATRDSHCKLQTYYPTRIWDSENMEGFSPAVMSNLARQIRALMSNPPEGVKFVPIDGNAAEINADIFGPGQQTDLFLLAL